MSKQVILEELEIQQIIEETKVAFPSFTNWQYNNEKNEDYFGFSIWGEFILDANSLTPQCFFITFDTYNEQWQGHLSIGKPCYFWTSADVGDAHLLDTKPCSCLKDAIFILKLEISNLFRAFSIL
jgi:hypothetical protein